MTRTYEPWREKHKSPSGFGTHCPAAMREDDAQALLEQAVRLGDRLYAAQGDWCFVAHQHRPDHWHGFPVPGAEVGEHVLVTLERAEQIDRRQRRRLRKQKSLPEAYP